MMYQVAIFVDGGYLDKVLRREFNGARIDFGAFSRAVVAAIHPMADIFRTYYYHCLPYQSNPPTQEESEHFAAMQKFLDAVNRLPRFTVRLGRLARRGPDRNGEYFFEQKMVDVYLSIDLVHMSLKTRITHAAIVAGDSDFVPAIELARNEGISTWLFHGERRHVHNQLWDMMDERVKLTPELINSVPWRNDNRL
jgi:uncharacterized LabA/DUF88 family protein